MKIAIIIIVAVIALIAIYIFSCYNSLIKLRNSVEEAFSTMDVYLKKRWDLIPNIVSTVKGYAKHEAETLEKVVSMRAAATQIFQQRINLPQTQRFQGALQALSQLLSSILI